MKKLILIVSFILIAVFFVGAMSGCAAKKNAADEILQSLDQNNEQVIVALGKSQEAKYALLTSEDLTAEGLIALCIRPFPLNMDGTKQQFIAAIVRTPLTVEQQVQIANIGKSICNEGLLLRTDLSGEGLVTICENPGGINLKHFQLSKVFQDAVKRVELSAEHEAQIAKKGNWDYNKALLMRENLTGEGLITICENPGWVVLENPQVFAMFEVARNRVELSDDQRIRLSKSRVYSGIKI